ncbi:MAG: M28 family peptidase [Bryobacterales bacterium]|nr:M28 family peptidase [Bryobacterales bacterium]
MEDRLRLAVANEGERRIRLTKLMEESGCTGDAFTEQRFRGSKQPNLICSITASSAESTGTIIVGAHYDSAGGEGVIDNWTGAILLPSLFEMIRKSPTRHHFQFVGFAAEEQGLLGSREYVRRLSKEQRKRIVAVVTIDSLGLTPTKVWTSHSDPALVQICANIAKALQLDLQARNADAVGRTDSMSFASARIPVLSLHSVTTETLAIINSEHDVWSAVSWKDYYDSYRLIAAMLVYLDEYGVPGADGSR